MTEARLAPPVPRRSLVADYRKAARLAGFEPMAWQLFAARVITGLRRGRWAYPEAAIIVARQNGKTSLLVPRIVMGLLAGERIMHTAQNRELPRETFGIVADVLHAHAAPAVRSIRVANGQEVIRMADGGTYRIVAPTRGGARGPSNDLVIVDEAREMDTFDFVAAAGPTLTASRNGQILYLSNAGDETSIVLNSLRRRADSDPRLAYLEWSAHPDRHVGDRAGWREANPAMGHTIRPDYLEGEYRSAELGGTLGIFETEHLCRWVTSLAPRIVADVAWQRAAVPDLGEAVRPILGVSLDPAGGRASAVLAWIGEGNTVCVTLAADVTGSPLDVDAFGRALAARARELRVAAIAHDPATDGDLARFLRNSQPIAGQAFAAASDRFARTVEGGRLRHAGAEVIGSDLTYTARRVISSGAWYASRAKDDRPITAALAAVRAVWLATAPERGKPAVY